MSLKKKIIFLTALLLLLLLLLTLFDYNFFARNFIISAQSSLTQAQGDSPLQQQPASTQSATGSGQQAAIEEPEVETQEEILQRQRLAQQIDDLQARLLVELDQYQQDEKQYRIALDQFQRLRTLSSIEGASVAAKRAMLSRNRVLLTYSDLMRLKLIEAEGIEITQKQAALNDLEQQMQQLKVFTSELNLAENRDQVNNLATQFEVIGARVENNCYRTLSLLAIGKLQAVYDQANAIYQQVKKQEGDDLNFLQQTQRKRALSEVEKLQTNIPPMFQDIWSQVANAASDDKKFKSFYRGVFDDLNPVYSQLSQFVAYLEELEQVK